MTGIEWVKYKPVNLNKYETVIKVIENELCRIVDIKGFLDYDDIHKCLGLMGCPQIYEPGNFIYLDFSPKFTY